MIKIDENAVSSFNWTPTVLGLQKTAMSYMDKLLGSSRILQPSVSVLEKGDMETEHEHMSKKINRMMPDKRDDIFECDCSLGLKRCS